jgi:hypothetical protein
MLIQLNPFITNSAVTNCHLNEVHRLKIHFYSKIYFSLYFKVIRKKIYKDFVLSSVNVIHRKCWSEKELDFSVGSLLLFTTFDTIK